MDVGNPEVRHSAGFENRLPAPPNLNGGTLYSKPYLPLRAQFSASALADEPGRARTPLRVLRHDGVALGAGAACALVRLLHSIRESSGKVRVLVLLGESRPAAPGCSARLAGKAAPKAPRFCSPRTGGRESGHCGKKQRTPAGRLGGDSVAECCS